MSSGTLNILEETSHQPITHQHGDNNDKERITGSIAAITDG